MDRARHVASQFKILPNSASKQDDGEGGGGEDAAERDSDVQVISVRKTDDHYNPLNKTINLVTGLRFA